MKKTEKSTNIVDIQKTILDSAITGGPNNFQLMLSLFDHKKIFFWLDDTVKIEISVKGLLDISSKNTSDEWVVTGKLKYARVYFNFSAHYNSSLRQGCLPLAKGFLELGL